MHTIDGHIEGTLFIVKFIHFEIPEIVALSKRGGTNILFGVPGDLGSFRMGEYTFNCK